MALTLSVPSWLKIILSAAQVLPLPIWVKAIDSALQAILGALPQTSQAQARAELDFASLQALRTGSHKLHLAWIDKYAPKAA